MESRPIPPPKKPNDKGIASALRQLKGTLSVHFEGVSRRTIYSTARRLKMKVITRAEGDGLRVWRKEEGNIGQLKEPVMSVQFSPEVPVREAFADERWVFVDATTVEHHDNGNFYRQQMLLPQKKQRRTVQVDPDDLERIIKVGR